MSVSVRLFPVVSCVSFVQFVLRDVHGIVHHLVWLERCPKVARTMRATHFDGGRRLPFVSRDTMLAYARMRGGLGTPDIYPPDQEMRLEAPFWVCALSRASILMIFLYPLFEAENDGGGGWQRAAALRSIFDPCVTILSIHLSCAAKHDSPEDLAMHIVS
ncbi:hypothetical protein SCHPADRAFT_895569 [Schizopora paradoxa]|uniref:Uncharacterized protein n=1 Tax=Schizopora paradoxa TaxID=27342 RepID=A0A0H2R4L9_9AGAM|nr:hypothetical protein SCHPADRAFT_895569 [Schizopora paradoxa]